MKKILLISLLLATTNVFAQSAAVTLAVTNKVIAKMKRTERPLNRGSALSVGDAVITANNALATLKYGNGTIVDLGERSSYQILAYNPKQSEITIKASLNSGKLHSKTSGRLKETLKTPVVALSILGTDYNVYIASPTKVYVRVNQGQVQARSKIIHAGESYVITPTRMYPARFPQEGYVTSKGVAMMGNGQSGGSGSAGGPGSSAGPQSASGTATTQNAIVAQAKKCQGNNCANDETCPTDWVTNNYMDVVDTSLYLGATTYTIGGYAALIA